MGTVSIPRGALRKPEVDRPSGWSSEAHRFTDQALISARIDPRAITCRFGSCFGYRFCSSDLRMSFRCVHFEPLRSSKWIRICAHSNAVYLTPSIAVSSSSYAPEDRSQPVSIWKPLSIRWSSSSSSASTTATTHPELTHPYAQSLPWTSATLPNRQVSASRAIKRNVQKSIKLFGLYLKGHSNFGKPP